MYLQVITKLIIMLHFGSVCRLKGCFLPLSSGKIACSATCYGGYGLFWPNQSWQTTCLIVFCLVWMKCILSLINFNFCQRSLVAFKTATGVVRGQNVQLFWSELLMLYGTICSSGHHLVGRRTHLCLMLKKLLYALRGAFLCCQFEVVLGGVGSIRNCSE